MGTQWWVNDSGYGILPGNTTYGGGGGNLAADGAVQFRSPLDAARAAHGKIPQAEYPDGYLGSIIDRQHDKLMQAVKNTLTARSYQRGVHKGSRISADDYFWPSGNVTPYSGVEREAGGMTDGHVILVPKFCPTQDPVEKLAHMGKTSGMATPGELGAKLQEARRMGVDPSMNPIVPPDPKLMLPRYRLGRRDLSREWNSGK